MTFRAFFKAANKIPLFLLTIFLTPANQIWAAKSIGATKKICADYFTVNANASTKMANYSQANDRNNNAYIFKLGPAYKSLFENKKRRINWMDVGAGFGLAPLQMISEGYDIKATVINAQDAWAYLGEIENFSPMRDKLMRIGFSLSVKDDDIVSIREDNGHPMFAYNWPEKLLPRIFSAYEKLTKERTLDYRVGFAENIIPTLNKQYELITDVYGAYFYSVDRVGLIEDYYNSLFENGEAFVVIFSEDRHIFSEPPRVVSYGPISKMDGLEKSFEDELIARYPTVFSYSVVDDRQGLVRSLHIRKDPKINRLDLRAMYEIIDHHVDAQHPVEIMGQIPQITVRRK